MKLFGGARNISGSSSVLLDSLRIVAAMTVFISHVNNQWHFSNNGQSSNSHDIGHSAVIVFFVLSGYVIAHTTTSNNRGKLQYAQARLSRLYSVALPAIIITLAIQIVVKYISEDLYIHFIRGSSWPRYVMSSFFINEVWFFSAAPPINGPLWSLSFEFWYYVIFGLFFYKVRGLKGYILPILACLVAGPKILIMMPIWLMGAFAYRCKRVNISKPLVWLFIILSLIISGILVIYFPLLPSHVGMHPLIFAAQFITDWVIGLFVALAVWLLPNSNSEKGSAISNALVKILRKLADLTFPIYVLHFPLIVLWRAIFGTGIQGQNNLSMFVAIGGITFICVIIGNFLENKRHLWTSFFKGLLLKVKRVSTN